MIVMNCLGEIKYETTQTWNLSASCCPEMDCMKPWNHETMKPRNLSTYFCTEMECMEWIDEPRNHKQWNLLESCCPEMEARRLSTYHCPEMEWMDRTMKPQIHETYQQLAVQRWSERNHETCLCLTVSVVSTNGVQEDISHETIKPQILFCKMCHDLSS